MPNHNQSQLGHTRFPALGAGYMYWFIVLFTFVMIGHYDCFGFAFAILNWKALYYYYYYYYYYYSSFLCLRGTQGLNKVSPGCSVLDQTSCVLPQLSTDASFLQFIQYRPSPWYPWPSPFSSSLSRPGYFFIPYSHLFSRVLIFTIFGIENKFVKKKLKKVQRNLKTRNTQIFAKRSFVWDHNSVRDYDFIELSIVHLKCLLRR